MNVLVTGGTGFIGKALVRRLIEAGHRVTVLSRDPQRAAKSLPVRCRTAGWTSSRELDPQVLAGADAVIHLAGEGVADRRWNEARKRAIHDSRVLGTRTLVKALAKLPSSQRPATLLSASAIGVYGDRGDEILDETSAPGSGFLAEVCRDWEDEIFAARELGLRTVAVRIGIVLGNGGGALQQMLPLFRLGVGGRVGSGNQWMSWIHLDDLVGLFEYALTHEQVSGTLNGTAPRPVTNADFTADLARAVQRPALIPVPAVALQLALGEMSTIVLASQRVLPRGTEQSGFQFRHPLLAPALATICADDFEVLEREQWLPQPIEAVFPFFADARNLEQITPPFLHFEVQKVEPREVRDGTLIDYRLRLHGFPVSWQSRIEEFVPGLKFVDTQTRGPYSLWHHTHEFEEYEGGTIVRDRVRYRLPLAPLGNLVAGSFVNRDLEQIFDYRRQKMEELFPVSSPKRAAND